MIITPLVVRPFEIASTPRTRVINKMGAMINHMPKPSPGISDPAQAKTRRIHAAVAALLDSLASALR
jgi:hypothetical protein